MPNRRAKIPARGAVLAALQGRPGPRGKAMAWDDVRSCIRDVLRGIPHEIIDVTPNGILAHTLDDAGATAAMHELERVATRLAVDAPILCVFRLPDEHDALRRALAQPAHLAPPVVPLPDRRRLKDIMRGKDLDAYRIDQPIWHFGETVDVAAYAVRIDFDTLAADLGVSDLLTGELRADIEQMAAERLIAAYGRGRPGHRHRQFIRVPRGMLAMDATWKMFESKPAAGLDHLVIDVDVAAGQGGQAAPAAAVARLSRLGFATSARDIDWSSGASVEAPPSAKWVAGAVAKSATVERLTAAVGKIGVERAIAMVGADADALDRALAAGFVYAVGPAADAMARQRRIQGLIGGADAETAAAAAPQART